jgi:serine/threonine protein kinase
MSSGNLIGKILGPYTLEAVLGKGGMATVYRAYQTSVKRYVAVKVMAREISEDPAFIERFEREAQIVASLEHPHILPIIDYGNHEGLSYIVMRYMDGGSLDDVMRKRRIPLPEVAKYLDQIASALDYAHRRGVVHRDLKPNNVLLDASNNCYLTDFGIARLASAEHKLTQTGTVLGTPSYVSPEQALGQAVDGRSDLYTLGVMAYEMVLGRLPFNAETPAALMFQHVYEAPPPAHKIDPTVPVAVSAVLDKVLAKKPDDRYTSGADYSAAFIDAMRGFATPSAGIPATPYGATAAANPVTPVMAQEHTAFGPPTPGVRPTPLGGTSEPESKPVGKRPTNLLAIAAALLLVLGGGAIALSTSGGNNNANATSTGQAQQTTTAVAVLALSATATSTNTPEATATNTATPTNTSTPTPDATATALGARMATFDALSQNLTATSDAQATAAAAGLTQTAQAVFNGTATLLAERLATIAAFERAQTLQAEANATAIAFAATATALAPTVTPTPIDTATYTPSPRPTNRPLVRPTATSGDAALPTIVASVSDLNLLLATDPNTVLEGLYRLNSLPVGRPIRKSLITAEPFVLTGRTDESNVFYAQLINTATYYDFVLSLDVSIKSSADAQGKTRCGIAFDGQDQRVTNDALIDQEMLVFSFTRTGLFAIFEREIGSWGTDPISSTALNVGNLSNDTANRLTLVVRGKKVQIFFRNRLIVERENLIRAETHAGQLALFMIRGITGSTEQCTFSNVNIWRIY